MPCCGPRPRAVLPGMSVRSPEHRDRDFVPPSVQLHLRTLRGGGQCAQPALDSMLFADHRHSRPCLSGIRGTRFHDDDSARSRPPAQRLPVLLLLRRRASWLACQCRPAVAGHDDGAGFRQGLPCGHYAAAALFQSFLARARHHLGRVGHDRLSDWRKTVSYETERNVEDVGPGFMGAATSVRGGILGYIIGLVLAALLTAASFAVIYTNLIWGPAIPAALVTLAVAQMGVHLVFFLHLTTAPDNTNNAMALAFGVLIVALIIGGSLWVKDHLNRNMAPTHHMMEMQR